MPLPPQPEHDRPGASAQGFPRDTGRVSPATYLISLGQTVPGVPHSREGVLQSPLAAHGLGQRGLCEGAPLGARASGQLQSQSNGFFQDS